MDKGWVQMEVQGPQLHYRILSEMANNRAFEGGARLGDRKVKTWEAFNCCRRSSASRPWEDERSHFGRCDGYAEAK
jgi:hypothetical protein